MAVDTLSLSGLVAIVTGSARENGIGAAIAIALARNGAAVTINYVSQSSASRAEGVANTIKTAGGKSTIVQADVSTPDGAAKIVQETLKAFGTEYIDILVNNAGYGNFHSTLEISPEDIEKVFAINVHGPIYLTKAVVPHMPSGGRIINITSVASKMGIVNLPIYGASKAALDSLTYAWAKEFGKTHGITVNSLAPGPVNTDIVLGAPDTAETGAHLVSLTRAGSRVGGVEDIADAALLLVSEKSRWITGQHISVSGGITGP